MYKMVVTYILYRLLWYYQLFYTYSYRRRNCYTHAHPFQQTTDGTCHEHASLEEIILFHTLTSIHATDGAVHALQICLFIPSYFALTESLRYPDYWVSVSGEISLRAPPVV